jgi:MFS family permease
MAPTASSTASPAGEARRGIPIEVILLGIVSFLTDLSSEALFAILPIYFISVVGGSAIALGVMEGVADFASSSLDLASGYVSDRTGKRKWIACSGYALSAAAKSLLLFVTTAAGVAAFRIIERLGKSIRGAPRDALLASIAPHTRRGLSFGLHKALDKAGAVVGPVIAYYVLATWGTSAATFHRLFFWALIPAIAAVVVLAIWVRDRPMDASSQRLGLREAVRALRPRYWWYLISTAVFSMGYFSFAFLLLKASDVGFAAQDQALLYGLFNLVFTLVSVPIGWLGDRIGRRAIVVASYLVYALVAAGFLWAESRLAILGMFSLYGVFYAMDEGQAKAFLADLSEDQYRASAIGLYGFVTGLAYLPASVIAGILWEYGPAWTFGFAVATSLCAAFLFATTSWDRKPSWPRTTGAPPASV